MKEELQNHREREIPMPGSVVLIVVSSDARLGREIATKFPTPTQPVQLRSLDGVRKKLVRHPAALLLLILKWNSTDGEAALRTLSDLRRNFPAFRFVVFCPDLPEQTVADAETLRFLYLEYGATAVFANRRELASFSSLLEKHFDAHPALSTNCDQWLQKYRLEGLFPPQEESYTVHCQ